MALCPRQPGRLGRKASPSPCRDLPAGGVLGVIGLRPWALGSPGLVCLLSWASSQHLLCSSWLTSCTMVAEGGGLSGRQLGMEPLQGAGEGRPQSALTVPCTSTTGFSFLLGQVNIGAESAALSSPWGSDKGRTLGGRAASCFRPSALATLGPHHPLPPASLVYTSWPESLT